MSRQSRRQRLSTLNHRWIIGIAVAATAVVVAIVGIALVRADELSRPWAYVFVFIALIGAVGALLMTVARGKAGDTIDESTL